MADYVEIYLALRNLRQFVSGTKTASDSITGIGKAADKTGKSAKSGWKSIAKWGGAASVLYGAQKFIRGAVSATEDLGKSTLALNRTTGMDVRTSSEWATVLKARGSSVKPFQMGLIKLSRVMEQARLGQTQETKTMRDLNKQYEATRLIGGKHAPAALAKLSRAMESARAKGEKSREIWTRLGVSMDAVKRGDIQTVIEQTSDAFARMRNPAERAAIAQQLFSRQGRELAPILFKGSKAIREQLKTAGKYVNFQAKNAKQVAEEIKHQRELRTAYLGVQVSVGTALLPVILAITGALVKLTQIMAPLTRNATLLKIGIAALALAFVAYKVAMIAATIATTVFETAAAPVALIAAGIVIGLIALAAAIYLVVKHWGAIKRAMQVVWAWVKTNWPLLLGVLLGPFALATVLIIRHFDRIKQVALSVVDAITGAFDKLVAYVRALPSKLVSPLKGAGGIFGRVARRVIPGLQGGGVVKGAGRVLVGERGPEVLALPAGATVQPLPQTASLAGVDAFGTAEIIVPVYLDRRVLAQAVARYTSDKRARR